MSSGKGKCTSPTDFKNVSKSQTDSGFLSGSNLVSSCSIDGESQDQQARDSQHKRDKAKDISQCVDSGIDISEQLSSLNIRPESPKSLVYPTYTCSIVPDYAYLEKVLHRDEDGDTQLHVAAMGGWIEHVWHITRKIPDQALLDLPNHTGRTALHLATAAGDARVARHILVVGGSPVARDCRGNTPLHVACNLGNIEMVIELTKPITTGEIYSAKIPYQQSLISGLVAADITNYDGQTCIHIAAQTGNTQILQYLTHYGADINAKEGKCGRTALHYAVGQRDPNLVSFLVSSCRASLSIETYGGLTPYQLALANDAPALANLLVELGAQGDPLPSRFDSLEELEDNEETTYEGGNWNRLEGLKMGGVHIPISTPVSTGGGASDFYQ